MGLFIAIYLLMTAACLWLIDPPGLIDQGFEGKPYHTSTKVFAWILSTIIALMWPLVLIVMIGSVLFRVGGRK